MNYANQTTDLNPTYELLQQDSARTRLDLATQRANSAAIATSIKSLQGQLVNLDSESVKQGTLLRDEKADEANYLLYLNKREQERTSNAMDARRIANVVIAVPAVPAALPAFNPFLLGFGGVTLALLLGLSAAFVLDWMDPTFRSSAEVTKALGLPVLAAIPRQVAGKRVITLMPQSDIRHNARALSTHLDINVPVSANESSGQPNSGQST